jgi:hypothetical protein
MKCSLRFVATLMALSAVGLAACKDGNGTAGEYSWGVHE